MTPNVYTMLEMIKKRPSIYTGQKTLSSIRIFLEGYKIAMWEMELSDKGAFPHGILPELELFHDWVANNFGFSESTAGWCNMIYAVTIGCDPQSVSWSEVHETHFTPQQEEQAINLFFVLLEEFKSDPDISATTTRIHPRN